MEKQPSRTERPAMTFDELSLDKSKSFVKALQELKELRPQLYSAAEYCEKSYLLSEQKQMVLDNLKDYAVRALVNAVDHLGTVSYKLTDLLEQQALDISSMELKFVCLNQKILTSQTYTDREGLRQQQLLAFIPRHHKHYILPNSVNKKVHFSPYVQKEPRQSYVQAKPRLHPSDNPASKTLSWHLSSETTPISKDVLHASMSSEDVKTSFKSFGVFHLSDAGEGTRTNSATHLHLQSGGPAARVVKQVTQKGFMEGSKTLTALKSLDRPHRHEIVRSPISTKSMISAFFVKHKTRKAKKGPLSK